MKHELGQLAAVDAALSSLRENGDPYPFCVEIHPTDFCNQACSYCFHGGIGEDKSRRHETLSVTQYRSLIDELAALGVAELSISGGGEPMLYGGISEVLQHAADSPLRLRVVTNGNFIPEESIGALLGAAEVRVSIDSTVPAVYNQQRGLTGGNLLSKTLRNLGTLVALRGAEQSQVRLAATFLISQWNAHELESFAQILLDDVGVDVVLYKTDIYGRIGPSAAGVGERLKALARLYGPRVETREPVFELPASGRCMVPYIKAAFNPYGELYSCCLGSQPGEKSGTLLGSLNGAGSFEGLWTQSRPTRTHLLDKGIQCADCNHTDRQINLILRTSPPAQVRTHAAERRPGRKR